MALPLLWLGAGVLAAATANSLNKSQLKAEGVVGAFPGDSRISVKPQNGSVVCCGIYEVLHHTGIWVDGNIVELNGNGLIRAISPHRFLHDRSGAKIYVAADRRYRALTSERGYQTAIEMIYQYKDYDVIENNCHRFTHYCLTGKDEKITLFSELNQRVSELFGTEIHWQVGDC